MRIVSTLVVLACAASLPACRTFGGGTRIDFESDPTDAEPRAFESWRTGPGPYGEWRVVADATAPSGTHVLAQVDEDATEKRFPHAVLRGPPLRDVRIAVKCKALRGRVDQACGLVVRWQGPDDYYAARANALEGNVRLYHFVRGVRTQIAGWDGAIAAGVWHDFALEVVGDRLRVQWDGTTVIEKQDATILNAGRVGLWTKADSVSEFDDVEVTPK